MAGRADLQDVVVWILKFRIDRGAILISTDVKFTSWSEIMFS